MSNSDFDRRNREIERNLNRAKWLLVAASIILAVAIGVLVVRYVIL